ncbi:MAG: peptidase [Bacteroidetes bacterium]|nr:peptidase [Bacteroidota bacterium]
MKIAVKTIITALAAVMLAGLQAAGQYRDHATMNRDLAALAKANPSVCEYKSLVKTAGGKDIYVLIIGTGDRSAKPGIAVLGGVEGSYVLGREIAAGFAASIIKNAATPEIKTLLSKVTFYVLPDLSPDASEQFFAKLRYERNWNSRPVDFDRDFVTGEDPFEDLNGDGLVTMIRVHDSGGTFIDSPDDPRLMVQADIAKGQKGKYIVYTEGIDNDNDGAFNEDGEGGVNFNNNWTYNYQEFGRYAGMHAVSEPETKAVADFLFDQWNIFATVAFGPQDNLTSQPRAGTGASTGGTGAATAFQAPGARPGTATAATATADRNTISVGRTDETVNRIISEKYIAATSVKGSPAAHSARGNFMEWAYFHYGRYSYSTPGWWPAIERGRNAEAAFLKYAEENGLGEVFVPWTEIQHPGFPGKKVEVGGIKPFVMINPPAEKVPEIVEANYKFLTAMAALHPDVQIADVKVENTGGDIFRLTLTVRNNGLFPTMAEIGSPNRFVRIPRVTLTLEEKQTIITGTRVQQMRRIEGNSSSEYSWLIRGKGTIGIKAGDTACGVSTATAVLR